MQQNSKLTNERLAQVYQSLKRWADHDDALNRCISGQKIDPVFHDCVVALAELQEFRKAAAESAGWQVKRPGGNWVSIRNEDINHYRFNEELPVREVFTAPIVPDVLGRLRSIVADPKALPRRKEWISGQQYSYVLLENVEAMVDETCRAAMLQTRPANTRGPDYAND